MAQEIRIGCWAGAWGDSSAYARQLVERGDLDYLIADHLAEVTMALLARRRTRDAGGGYVPDVVESLGPLLGRIRDQGLRLITNGGGLDPHGCAAALRAAAARAGVDLRIAVVMGDDLLDQADDLRADPRIAAALPPRPLTLNAYLGARPICVALDGGADVVVTGRCADSALALGALMHEFGWDDQAYDLLSAGSLVGHILECGTQCTGGLFTDWETVPGWDDMGAPIAVCREDGTAVITKAPGTGGLVSVGTVAEQIVYEIGDPGAYVLPDVVCDWRAVRLEQHGPDRVAVRGARGHPPTTAYKASATYRDGHRLVGTAMVGGLDAGAKARRAGHAILARAGRLAGAAGHRPFTHTSVEVIGAGDTYGRGRRNDAAREVVLKVAARHPDAAALAVLAREVAPAALAMAPGITGMFGGRARPAPAIGVASALVAKDRVRVRVHLDDEVREVAIAPGRACAPAASPPLDGSGRECGDRRGEPVPLSRIAHARSGDKGNDANIGVIARLPEYLPAIREQVTAERVREFFEHHLEGDVTAWELPGLYAVNFLLTDVLGGAGGTTSLRYDPQGKAYASMLLELPVTVPSALLDLDRPAPGGAV
ncbi:acyclic terpene utilization AtuA family protein [Actinomadura luteofluorescens]|uniref:acyclic terpene utilization AtuA family protein n=1 Tax=Actinomadura luteofluorescens TaxID=46163 RepID=UPI003D9156F1